MSGSDPEREASPGGRAWASVGRALKKHPGVARLGRPGPPQRRRWPWLLHVPFARCAPACGARGPRNGDTAR
eukprot:8045188-Pyramimonas_sp.AAC.1